MPSLRRTLGRWMLAILLALGFVTSGTVLIENAGADPNIPFFPPPSVGSLPAGAVSAILNSTSCWSAGNCVAVGTSSDGTNNHGIYVVETDGSWGDVVQVADPSGGPNFSGSLVDFTSVSCPSADNCVAVGSYDNSQYGTQSLALIFDGSQATLEPVYFSTSIVTSLEGVSCWATQQCMAVGVQITSSGSPPEPVVSPIAISLNGGTWSSLTNVDQGALTSGSLLSVDCESATSCDAVGEAISTGSAYVPIAASESGGPWSSTQALAIPSNVVNGHFESVSCWSAGNCVAVGGGNVPVPTAPVLGSAPQAVYSLVASESGGTWGPATQIPNPAGHSNSRFWSVSCAGPGSCTALGDTDVSTVNAPVLGSPPTISVGYPIAVSLSGGSWSTPQVFSTTRAGMRGLSCVSSVICTAVGFGQASIVFTSSLPTLTIMTTSLPNATPGVLYTQQLTVAGGTAPVSYSVTSGSLPPGLVLNATTGLISGTTSSTGTYTFTVTATDAGTPNQVATATFTLTSSLASTGFNLTGPTSIALLLLGAGAGLFVVGRRRRLLSDTKSN
jgi:Putative Ig domain